MPKFEDENYVGMGQEDVLSGYEPDNYDPEQWEKDHVAKAPPPDGDHPVALFLAQKEDAVRVKAETDRVVATVKPRLLKPDGSLGGFTKDWYPNTYIGEDQTTSSLATVAFAAGDPFTKGMDSHAKAEHIRTLFARAGERGIRAMARTAWNKSNPKVDGQGSPIYKDGKQVYVEARGQAAIEAQAMKEAARVAGEAGLSGDEWEAYMAEAKRKTHLYYDPLTNEERVCRVEILRLSGRYNGPS